MDAAEANDGTEATSVDIEEEIEVKNDEDENKSEVFKKPQLLVGPRRGKAVGKIRSIESKGTEKELEEQETVSENVENTIQDKPEGRSAPKSSFSPAQKMKENSIPLPYIEPKWGGMPKEHYAFEVLKSGKILEKINLNSKSFFVFGRLSTCDIHMTHPTISRYHAILQYRAEASEDATVGYYLYDLGSTHGSFVNKKRIKPNIYVRIRVGYIIKLGCSSRLFLLQGPDKDMEAETELTVTELKEKRNRELIAKEAQELREQNLEEEREKQEADKGIDWGMGEDADEETDLAENPYATTQNEELYITDPKKTLRGWFEREGYELEYDVEEKNFGEFLCRVELPIESSRGGSVMAEAILKGKKKEAVVQCALEACRILDRYGLLRQATHESKKRKAKDWEAEDFYDSDDDTFLDRTGSIEKKRQKRMKAAGKKDPEEVVETYDSLQKKHSEVLSQLQKLEEELEKSLAIIGVSKTEANPENEEEDALDAFMSTLHEETPDKKHVSKLKSQISTLKQEEVRLSKLINIAKPASLPQLPSQKKTVPEASKNKSLPLIGARRKPSSSGSKQKSVPQPIQLEGNDAEEEEEEEDEEEEKKQCDEKLLPLEKENTNQQMPKETENNNDADNSEIQEKTEASETAEIISMNIAEDENDKSGEAKDTSNSEIQPRLIGPAMPPPEQCSLTTDFEKQENKKEHKEEKKKQKSKKNKGKQAQESSADYDASDPDYAVWMPPEDQSGDGRTKLNDKYGY